MTMAVGAAALLLALLCAAIMGLAIQRGGTCTVAAMDELLVTGRPTRLMAMIEAALWVGGGLLLARGAGFVTALPAGFALTGWTWAGAVLLGLGAIVNRACVIGSIARLGSGDLAFAAMPVGLYVGCATADRLFMPPAPQPLEVASTPGLAPAWLVGAVGLLAIVRLVLSLRSRRAAVDPVWSPHAATALIGLAFLGLVLLVGAWSYTELLADLARAMASASGPQNLSARVGIGAALLAGAIVGGRLTGQLRRQPVAGTSVARCFVGGMLMGWGSLLTPGGNDALVLIGMPLLWPYAWTAFAAMCMTVAIARWAARQLERWRSQASV
jgi:toxin CptA